jgi:hypothetical protein
LPNIPGYNGSTEWATPTFPPHLEEVPDAEDYFERLYLSDPYRDLDLNDVNWRQFYEPVSAEIYRKN